jgi:hypothetical protein
MKISIKFKVIITIVLVLALFFTDDLLLISSKITCARAKEITTIKVTKYLVYEFYVDNEKKQSKRALRLFKIQDIDSLRKMECIKIRYSTIWNSVTEVIDERIVK